MNVNRLFKFFRIASIIGLLSILASAQAADLNRQPECYREQAVVDDILAKIAATGQPQGREIIPATEINDPLYYDLNWSKYQAGEIFRKRDGGSRMVTRYEVVVHYMYNRVTNSVEQVKLKNSKQDGCDGTSVIAGDYDESDGDYYSSQPADPLSTASYQGLDTVANVRTGTVVVGPLLALSYNNDPNAGDSYWPGTGGDDTGGGGSGGGTGGGGVGGGDGGGGDGSGGDDGGGEGGGMGDDPWYCRRTVTRHWGAGTNC